MQFHLACLNFLSVSVYLPNWTKDEEVELENQLTTQVTKTE